ncbi:LPXTG cell wall anchor domain-containing protein [Staphylococcus caledonicus]|uniref:LPXTG cell wall anchor domain-containing protein n=1 Tax=Staphylococcus sp. acrmy TaxID=2929076 RepID=UPI001F5A66DD|nr:LPXTG cell wall anchor domain-containing protein [Staphylococcus sp. acrmy]MCI2946894.1 LPXTG cell wall anchor domain-containing protein [Staphylococcus sp. acrmy]
MNTYYVGNVASTEVPSSKTNTHQSTSNKTLPQTGDANHHQPIQALGSSLFLLGSLILINLTTRKTA